MVGMLDVIRKNLVIILILVLSFGAFGLSAYNVMKQPNQIQEYFQEHKTELKGDKGEKGNKGPQGKAGKTGAQGVQGWAGTVGATGTQGTAGTSGAAGAAGQEGCTWLGWSDWGTDLGFYCP